MAAANSCDAKSGPFGTGLGARFHKIPVRTAETQMIHRIMSQTHACYHQPDGVSMQKRMQSVLNWGGSAVVHQENAWIASTHVTVKGTMMEQKLEYAFCEKVMCKDCRKFVFIESEWTTEPPRSVQAAATSDSQARAEVFQARARLMAVSNGKHHKDEEESDDEQEKKEEVAKSWKLSWRQFLLLFALVGILTLLPTAKGFDIDTTENGKFAMKNGTYMTCNKYHPHWVYGKIDGTYKYTICDAHEEGWEKCYNMIRPPKVQPTQWEQFLVTLKGQVSYYQLKLKFLTNNCYTQGTCQETFNNWVGRIRTYATWTNKKQEPKVNGMIEFLAFKRSQINQAASELFTNMKRMSTNMLSTGSVLLDVICYILIAYPLTFAFPMFIWTLKLIKNGAVHPMVLFFELDFVKMVLMTLCHFSGGSCFTLSIVLIAEQMNTGFVMVLSGILSLLIGPVGATLVGFFVQILITWGFILLESPTVIVNGKEVKADAHIVQQMVVNQLRRSLLVCIINILITNCYATEFGFLLCVIILYLCWVWERSVPEQRIYVLEKKAGTPDRLIYYKPEGMKHRIPFLIQSATNKTRFKTAPFGNVYKVITETTTGNCFLWKGHVWTLAHCLDGDGKGAILTPGDQLPIPVKFNIDHDCTLAGQRLAWAKAPQELVSKALIGKGAEVKPGWFGLYSDNDGTELHVFFGTPKNGLLHGMVNTIPGDSGAPIVTAEGHLIAVHCGKGATNVGWCCVNRMNEILLMPQPEDLEKLKRRQTQNAFTLLASLKKEGLIPSLDTPKWKKYIEESVVLALADLEKLAGKNTEPTEEPEEDFIPQCKTVKQQVEEAVDEIVAIQANDALVKRLNTMEERFAKTFDSLVKNGVTLTRFCEKDGRAMEQLVDYVEKRCMKEQRDELSYVKDQLEQVPTLDQLDKKLGFLAQDHKDSLEEKTAKMNILIENIMSALTLQAAKLTSFEEEAKGKTKKGRGRKHGNRPLTVKNVKKTRVFTEADYEDLQAKGFSKQEIMAMADEIRRSHEQNDDDYDSEDISDDDEDDHYSRSAWDERILKRYNDDDYNRKSAWEDQKKKTRTQKPPADIVKELPPLDDEEKVAKWLKDNCIRPHMVQLLGQIKHRQDLQDQANSAMDAWDNVAYCEDQIADLKEQARKRQADYTGEKNEQLQVITKLREAAKADKAKNETQASTIKKLTKETEDYKKEIATLKASLEKNVVTIKTLTTDMKTCQDELKATQVSLRKLEEQFKEMAPKRKNCDKFKDQLRLLITHVARDGDHVNQMINNFTVTDDADIVDVFEQLDFTTSPGTKVELIDDEGKGTIKVSGLDASLPETATVVVTKKTVVDERDKKSGMTTQQTTVEADVTIFEEQYKCRTCTKDFPDLRRHFLDSPSCKITVTCPICNEKTTNLRGHIVYLKNTPKVETQYKFHKQQCEAFLAPDVYDNLRVDQREFATIWKQQHQPRTTTTEQTKNGKQGRRPTAPFKTKK
ncbi:ORF1a [European roller astrovirus]|nr:ORF1a [European roller astrovirus]